MLIYKSPMFVPEKDTHHEVWGDKLMDMIPLWWRKNIPGLDTWRADRTFHYYEYSW